jgi:purine-cytosine permease-like protein
MIGFWATLSLNIPDFSRYAHSQRDQITGQLLGLPTTMALYSFIGAAVTSATVMFHSPSLTFLRIGILWRCSQSRAADRAGRNRADDLAQAGIRRRP